MFRSVAQHTLRIAPQIQQHATKKIISRGLAATFTPLTQGETDIIKATVPILEKGGEVLTKHFYKTMLSEYPAVVPYFNPAHQASGDQPRALANAVLQYAKNIDQLGNLGPLVGQIVNKHVALNINLEHYSIVGACLLRAIREVLGAEVATDAVIGAWAAAYGQLSAILINAEQGVYDAKAAAPGGWRGDREFVVKHKVKESSEITSFHLYPKDGKPILDYEAGQFIGLHITVDGVESRRNYSLSCASNGKYYRISVKREPNGRVSNHLHDHITIGSTLNLYPPAGDFTLAKNGVAAPAKTESKGCTFAHGGHKAVHCPIEHNGGNYKVEMPSTVNSNIAHESAAAVVAAKKCASEHKDSGVCPVHAHAHQKPAVFLAGGVGITPCIAMLEETLNNPATAHKPVYFIHAARTKEVQAFHHFLTDLAKKHPNLHYYPDYTADPATCTKEVLGKFKEFLPVERNVDVYFLGPLGFMQNMKKGLTGLGVEASNLHWEFFGPNKNLV